MLYMASGGYSVIVSLMSIETAVLFSLACAICNEDEEVGMRSLSEGLMEAAAVLSLACANCNEDEGVGMKLLSAGSVETAVASSPARTSCIEDEEVDMGTLSTGPPIESCSSDSLEHAIPRFWHLLHGRSFP
jgi:hypothetical protein